MKRLIVCVACALLATSCGSPTAPATVVPPTTTTIPPAPIVISLTGTVSAFGGARLTNATVFIADGANAGKSTTTDGNGAYRFDGLTKDNANVFARAASYDDTGSGVFLDSARTLNFTLRTTSPWTTSGTGDNVFNMPTYLTRVRVIGVFTGRSSNFIVRVGTSLLVNELLGTSWGPTRYDGTLLTSGGVVAITNSSGVAWSFTEVR